MSDYQDFAHDQDGFWREAGMPVEARLIFNYLASDGTTGSWVVNVQAFTNDRDTPLLRGHCLQRFDMQTFEIRSISECCDVLTGEQIPDVLEHLNALYRGTAAHTFDTIVYNRIDTLRALLYIMQRSGFSAARQLTALTQICRHLGRDTRISNHHVAPVVLRYRNAGESMFALVIHRLEKQLHSTARAGLLRMAQRIANHCGQAEQAALDAIAFMAKCFGLSESND